jgi:nicotinamidase/pyrazinamidase
MDKYRRNGDIVVATQDWHPSNHGSFAVNHDGKEPFDMGTLAGEDQIMWPEHCVQGSEGAQFVDELNSEDFQAIFRKGVNPKIDSYSGFYDNNREAATGLAPFLKGRGVEEITVTGVATEFCVKFTALDAHKEGFEVYVHEAACRPVVPEDGQDALRDLRETGVKTVASL